MPGSAGGKCLGREPGSLASALKYGSVDFIAGGGVVHQADGAPLHEMAEAFAGFASAAGVRVGAVVTGAFQALNVVEVASFCRFIGQWPYQCHGLPCAYAPVVPGSGPVLPPHW